MVRLNFSLSHRGIVLQLGSRVLSGRNTVHTSFRSSTPIAEELDLIPHIPVGRRRAKIQYATQLLAN
jgi:hypothetical protein